MHLHADRAARCRWSVAGAWYRSVS